MQTLPEPWQPLLDSLVKLRDGWPGVGWGWDARFRCVSSSFDKKIAARVLELTAATLQTQWTTDNFAAAPDDVRVLAERYGGVRAGQMVLAGSDVVVGMRLFGLWWPWGDGSTISLRLGIANSDRPNELFPQLRALFGVK